MRNIIHNNKMNYKGSKVSYFEKNINNKNILFPFISHYEIVDDKIIIHFYKCKDRFDIDYSEENEEIIKDMMKGQVLFMNESFDRINKTTKDLDLLNTTFFVCALIGFIGFLISAIFRRSNPAINSLIIYWFFILAKALVDALALIPLSKKQELLKYNYFLNNEDLIQELNPDMSINDIDNYSMRDIVKMVYKIELFKENEELFNKEINDQYTSVYGNNTDNSDINTMTVQDLNNYSISDLEEMISNIKESNDYKLQLSK